MAQHILTARQHLIVVRNSPQAQAQRHLRLYLKWMKKQNSQPNPLIGRKRTIANEESQAMDLFPNRKQTLSPVKQAV